MAEQQLDGGIANAGRVVRVGPHVLRPSSPHSGSIHAFLRAVRHAGFEGASAPVGIDEDGRERLMFIDGEVPAAPYLGWSQSDTALASIAMLLRGLHDAARGFDPHGLTWDDALADPAGGTLVCHNDVCPENVVFRDGIAVALLDFEFAAPGRPSTTWPSSPASVYRSTTTSTRPGSAGDPPTGRHGYDSSPTPTDWTGTVGRSCSPPWTMPSPASKQPSGAASTPVIRTPSRCGTGPVAASATTAGAAGGPTTTTTSPPPSADAHPLRSTHAAR